MRLAVFALVVAGLVAPASAQVRVNGYVKKDGTYVAPHYRSKPDGNPYNNYSTYPNVNPYTGAQGTKSPYGTSQGYRSPYSSSSTTKPRCTSIYGC